MVVKFLDIHFDLHEYLSIKFDKALSSKANLFLTKTNLEPVVFVARSKSNIFKFSPSS